MDKRQYQTPEVKVVVPPDLMLSIVDESAINVLSKKTEFVDEETEKDETGIPYHFNSIWDDEEE